MSETTKNQIKFTSVSDANYNISKAILTKEIEFVEKFDLNTAQLIYIKLLYYEDIRSIYRLLRHDVKLCNDKITQQDVNELFEKKLIKEKWIYDNSFPDSNALTEFGIDEFSYSQGVLTSERRRLIEEQNLRKQFLEIAGNQLFSIYPNVIYNNGNKIGPLKACKEFKYSNKVYEGRDDVVRLYCKFIDYNKEKHNEVINKIQVDKLIGYEYCNQSITSFVINRTWDIMPDKKSNLGGISL